jgi:hypothetical protein
VSDNWCKSCAISDAPVAALTVRLLEIQINRSGLDAMLDAADGVAKVLACRSR